MQKLNTALSIVLLVLVGYLLIDKFSGKDTQEEPEVVEAFATEELDDRIGVGQIAFINLDTLNANYKFLEDKLAELRTEQGKSERRMANKVKRAEEEYMQLQEDARYMTPSQMEEAQIKLQNSQLELQDYQERLANDLMKLEASMQEVLNDNIMGMVDEVNSKYGYDYILAKSSGGGILHGNEAFDITSEILDGLNASYAAEQEASEE
jgi:outer membrane protein